MISFSPEALNELIEQRDKALEDLATERAAREQAEKETKRIKAIGQDFERQYNATFEQSCKNLQRAESAEREVAALCQQHEATIGVGSGDSNLFLHGSHAAIKMCQSKLLRMEAAEREVAELQSTINTLHNLMVSAEKRGAEKAEREIVELKETSKKWFNEATRLLTEVAELKERLSKYEEQKH